jgi:hypothetical protein
MTRRTLIFIVSILFVLAMTQAAFSQAADSVDMHLRLQMQEQGAAPDYMRGQVFFSYSEKGPVRRVGIAFQHENFNTVHPFLRNEHNTFVLNYTPPEDAEQLVYRLVVDGVWMADPNNPQQVHLPGNISASRFELPQKPVQQRPVVTETQDGRVTFRFAAEQARRVAVAGSFNHWDPFMYQLQLEDPQADRYSLSLDLPSGTHYYYFVVDGRPVPDPHNPRMLKTGDGQYVSVLRVGG